ncbi:MAG: hypothetical protein CL512_04930 [Actinobacteria bacterium]|nr:hypothetical protein [Actinomycetota bacterium]
MSNQQDKQAVAQRLAEIKSAVDALKAEETQLRAQLSVGDNISGAFGKVSLSEKQMVSYEEDLYQDLLAIGVDPLALGKVKLSPNKEAVAVAVAMKPEVQVVLDKNRITKTSSVLRVKPSAPLQVEGMAKVASLLGS